MKKLLLPMLVALTIIMTISSCGKDDTKLGESMNGTYNGKITDTLLVDFSSAGINIDTNFLAPGVDASGTITSTTYDDSLSLQVILNVDGTPVDITVLAYINSETSFTVPKKVIKYLGAVPIQVEGSGSVSGNDATVNVKLAESDGSTELIYGDLNFTGSK